MQGSLAASNKPMVCPLARHALAYTAHAQVIFYHGSSRTDLQQIVEPDAERDRLLRMVPTLLRWSVSAATVRMLLHDGHVQVPKVIPEAPADWTVLLQPLPH